MATKYYKVNVTLYFGVTARNEKQANERAEKVMTSLLAGKGCVKSWYDDINYGYEVDLTEEE